MKRAAHSDRKINRNTLKQKETSKIFLMVLVGLGIIIFAAVLFLLAFFKRSWSEGSDRNILLIPETIDGYEGQILFAHISPRNNSIDIVMLNPEMSVNVIGGYGPYPIRSIYPLWNLEKKDERYLPAIYSFAMGKVIDEVWRSDKANFTSNKTSFKEVAQKLLTFKIASNLTLGDRIWLYKFTQSLRPDQMKVVSVNSFEEWQKVQANIAFADQSKSCNFAVVNTIAVSGVGTQVGKMLENSGFSIVRITDQEPASPVTELVVGENAEQCRDQQDHLLHTMPLQIKVVRDTSRAQQFRANMVLFIGSDMKPFF